MTDVGAPARPGGRRRPPYAGVAAVLAALCLGLAVLQEEFLSRANIVNLLSSASILALVALGLTFVMVAGEFDLSVGGTLALCGFVFAFIYDALGVPALAAFGLTVVVGVLIGGAVNGLLVGRLGVSFLVVTLGVLGLEQGLVQLVSEGQTRDVVSGLLDVLAYDTVLGVPVVVLVVLSAYATAGFTLRCTYFGRDVHAVGGNALAARLSGVDVLGTTIAVFAISGACAALAGVVQVARIGAASPAVGGSVLFDATAAVLLGGAALSGGVGSVGGTATGVLFLAVLQNGLTLTGLPGSWQQIATGGIVIGSVLLNQRARPATGGGPRLDAAVRCARRPRRPARPVT